MASDSPIGGRSSGRHGADVGYQWVSSSPSPAVVERLEALFPEIVAMPQEEIEAESDGWQRTAVILRSFQRWVPSEAILREFRRAGVQGEILGVSLAFRCHIFRFVSQEACDMVIKRPWVVNGQVLGVEAWRPQFAPAEDSVASVLLWVRMPNLPLEFWKEDFIKVILASAGDFVCVDAATLAKNRGAFARACLRVDLRRPLRPGVRIQGLGEPFWQQFSYESIQGICDRCGSLHLGAPCSSPAPVEGADEESFAAFGPWISSVRQRRVSPGSQASGKGRMPVRSTPDVQFKAAEGSRVGNQGVAGGWEVPRRVARRKPVSSPVAMARSELHHDLPPMDEAAGSSGTKDLMKDVKRAGFGTVAKSQKHSVTGNSRECNEKAIAESSNPFACLHVDPSVGGSFDVRDACPGSLKRARPDSYLAPRHSKSTGKGKGKGKAPVPKSGGGVKLVSHHNVEPSSGSQDSIQEVVGPHANNGDMVNRRQPGAVLSGVGLGLQSMMQEDQCNSGRADSVCQPECLRRPTEDGFVKDVSHPDCTMAVDQGVALSSPSL